MSNSFSKSLALKVWQKTNGLCWYCGIELIQCQMVNNRVLRNKNTFSVDHIIPKDKGGSNRLNNLLPCCIECNLCKKAKTLEQYRDYLRWKQAGVKPFVDSQIEWLLENGIELPYPPDIIFFGETLENGAVQQ